MRSVFTKILLSSLAILILSLGIFLVISRTMTYRSFDNETPIRRNALLQFDEANLEYQSGGPAALLSYLNWQHSFYPRLHFSLVQKGRDLVTGADHSKLLALAKSPWAVLTFSSPIYVAVPSPDSQFALVVTIPPQDVVFYWPYYLLLLSAIILLGWGLAVQFASPLNQLAETVRCFGAGSLSARVNSKRHDEIGDVARAFDQMAERIETLLTAERRLLQDISHELRSPLARLSFAAELSRTSPDRVAAAARVSKEVDRLTDLVGKLLQMTSPGMSDRMASDLETVALDQLVRELVQDCEIEAVAGGCKLNLTISEMVELTADRELLHRTIENILRNAIRHAPIESQVEVTMNQDGGKVSISIRDYGCGVPTEALTKIFEPFFRVDHSRSSATGGVGLGLAIAQRAVLMHGGQIWAENADPGLRVFVELPLAGVPSQTHQIALAVPEASHETAIKTM